LTYNTVICWFSLDNLELDSSHTAANKEEISLADRSIGFQEVWLEVDLEQVSSDTLDSVVDWQDMDAFAILDIRASMERDDISETDT
jgi:hypothetical protein